MLLDSARQSAVPRVRAPAPAPVITDAVRLVAELADNAVACCSPSGEAFVAVLLRQQGSDRLIHAVRHLGSGPSAQMSAHSAADRLRRGCIVTAHGLAIDAAKGATHGLQHNGRPAELELVGCCWLCEHVTTAEAEDRS